MQRQPPCDLRRTGPRQPGCRARSCACASARAVRCGATTHPPRSRSARGSPSAGPGRCPSRPRTATSAAAGAGHAQPLNRRPGGSGPASQCAGGQAALRPQRPRHQACQVGGSTGLRNTRPEQRSASRPRPWTKTQPPLVRPLSRQVCAGAACRVPASPPHRPAGGGAASGAPAHGADHDASRMRNSSVMRRRQQLTAWSTCTPSSGRALAAHEGQ